MRNEDHLEVNSAAMNNHIHPRTDGRRTRQCATYEEILPVLDEPANDRRLVEQAREHLATCAYCQAQHARYIRFDTLMRAAYAPDAMPLLRLEVVIGQTSSRKESNTMKPKPTPSLATQFVTDSEDEETPPHHQSPKTIRPQRRRWMSLLAPVAAILVIGAIILTLIAVQARFWSTLVSPTLPPLDNFQSISSISMLSANDGWAVENESPVSKGHMLNNQQIKETLLHYQQGRWSATQSFLIPVQGSNYFPANTSNQSISMDSLTDGWATLPVIFSTNSSFPTKLHTAMLHYDGRGWREVTLPTGYQMRGVKMLSSRVGWAFGYGPGGLAIMAYDGHSWRPQLVDSSGLTAIKQLNSVPSDMLALSVLSPTDAWAMAQLESTDPAASVIFHYHAGVWNVQRVLLTLSLRSLSFDAPDDGWAIGDQWGTTTSGTMINKGVFVHYHAGTWTVIPHANVFYFLSGLQVVMVSPTDGWAFGVDVVTRDNDKAILFHYDGKQWHGISQPQIKGRIQIGFWTLSVVGAADVWVGGDALWPAGTHYPTYPYVGRGSSSPPQPPVTPLLLRYHNGAWQTLLS